MNSQIESIISIFTYIVWKKAVELGVCASTYTHTKTLNRMMLKRNHKNHCWKHENIMAWIKITIANVFIFCCMTMLLYRFRYFIFFTVKWECLAVHFYENSDKYENHSKQQAVWEVLRSIEQYLSTGAQSIVWNIFNDG